MEPEKLSEEEVNELDGGFGWDEEVAEEAVATAQKMTEGELRKTLRTATKRPPAKVEKYRVICLHAPKNSALERGSFADFEAIDESHARRMFIQKFGIDPHGAGNAVLYNFRVIPQFEDYRPHAPYTSEKELARLAKYQEDRGKPLEKPTTRGRRGSK